MNASRDGGKEGACPSPGVFLNKRNLEKRRKYVYTEFSLLCKIKFKLFLNLLFYSECRSV
jgi:hypothetical protein